MSCAKTLAALLFCLSTFDHLAAQPTPGPLLRLKGHILDETNAPLSGAEVRLRLNATECRAFSGPTGEFVVAVPEAGEYGVNVAMPGFFDLRNRKVLVSNDSTELTLVLSRLREMLDSLDVSGASTVIDFDHPSREQRLNGAEVLALPYRNNNDARNAARTLAGVVQDSQGGIHVNGGAEYQTYYTIDGFNLGDPLTGTFQSRLNLEAIQSMSVLSGAIPAEYGKGAAGVLAIHTRNGDDKLRYAITNFVPGIQYRKDLTIGTWSPKFDVSGPIRKGAFWFSDSFATQYAQNYVEGLPAGQDRTSDWRFSNMFRAQANLKPGNILYAGFLANYWISPKSGLSALDPLETTVNRRASQWFYDVKDQIYFGRGSLFEYGYASNRTDGSQTPQGDSLYLYTAQGRRGNYFVDGKQGSSRDQWLANYFFPSLIMKGAHRIKIGADVNRLSYQQNIRRTGFVDYRADNTVAREVVFAGSGRLSRSNVEIAAYVQDSWRVRTNLLLELGVRTDRDQILRNWSVAPRFGFSWSPWKGDHTKISGGYGIIYNATSLVLFTRPRDQYPVTTFYPELGGYPTSIVSNYVIDRSSLASPRSQNLNIAWEQRFGGGFVGSVQGIARYGDHGLNYVDTTGLAPAGIYKLRDGRHDEFTGVEITVRQNLRRRYQWLASYTRSVSRSSAVIDLTVDQPLIVTNNSGLLPWDTPNRFVSWGILPTPLRSWSFGYFTEWRSGFPFSIQNDTGTIVGSVDSHRFPAFFEANLSLEREFDLRGQRWAWRMGVNNVTNHRNFDTVNNDLDSPRFLHFYGGQGRQLNFRVRWLGKQ